MGTHVQRKKFDDEALANEECATFNDPDAKVLGLTITVKVQTIEGQIWLYVMQKGRLVTGKEPVLPDYERVA